MSHALARAVASSSLCLLAAAAPALAEEPAYVAPAEAGKGAPIVFTSEEIENIAPGWRARETYRLPAADELVEVFELAEPGKDSTVYSETRLKRVRAP